ncbi:MAG: hypothetical protein IJ802_00850 [Kiritimatiellae bacterium]|nr:hypothetical protein [Kiritimatiellia bacterium]
MKKIALAVPAIIEGIAAFISAIGVMAADYPPTVFTWIGVWMLVAGLSKIAKSVLKIVFG